LKKNNTRKTPTENPEFHLTFWMMLDGVHATFSLLFAASASLLAYGQQFCKQLPFPSLLINNQMREWTITVKVKVKTSNN